MQAAPIDLTSDKIDRSQKPVMVEELKLDPNFKSPNERPLEDEDLIYYVPETRTAYTFRRYNWQVTKDSALAERLLSVLQARGVYNRSVMKPGLNNKQMEQMSISSIPQLKKWRDVRLDRPTLVYYFYSEFDKKLYVKEMNEAKAIATKSESTGGLFGRKKAATLAPPAPAPVEPEVSNESPTRTEDEAPKAKRERKPKAE